MEKFTFKTRDGVTIHGIKNKPSNIEKLALCFHMMPATKEIYLPLMQELEKTNWLAMAIDFRGHGESTEMGSLDWHNFDQTEHQEYLIDAQTLIDLESQAYEVDALIGASIGANVSLVLQSKNHVPSSVLLSPGLNYHSIETLPAAKQLNPDQSVYIIAAKEKGDLAKEAQDIYDAVATPKKQIDLYPEDLHGTNIINDYPDRLTKVITWLDR